MNEILKKLPFSSEHIDKQNYTASLLQLCTACGVISEARQSEIRAALDSAFTETAEQYTRRESSSISLKLAERLYSSVLYRADIYLLSLRDDRRAAEALLTEPADTMLEKGSHIIMRLYDNAAAIFRRAYKSRLSLGLAEYRYVMDRAFDEYRRGYSARFDARNCCASIDYPLLNRPAYAIVSQGAAFIYEYYTGIMLENEFCGHFNEKEIEILLVCYGRIYKSAYTDLLFNIAELIFNNLLAGALLKKPLFTILLSNGDIALLEEKFAHFSLNELISEAEKSFSLYKTELGSAAMFGYLSEYVPTFSTELLKRLKSGQVEKYIVFS